MKTISVAQIKDVLDACFEEYKRGEFQHKNVMFVGESYIGKSEVIKRWLEEHSDEIKMTCLRREACPLYEEVNGILKKVVANGKNIFGIANDYYEMINREGSVVFVDRYNYGLTEETKAAYDPIVKDRVFKTFYGEKMPIDNLWLFIAEMWPQGGVNSVTELPQEFYDCFDIYEVVPDPKELLDYGIANLNLKLEKARAQGDKEWEDECLFSKKLLTHVLTSGEFKFVFEKGDYLTPGYVLSVIVRCESKEELLSKIKNDFGESSKSYRVMEASLRDFEV